MIKGNLKHNGRFVLGDSSYIFPFNNFFKFGLSNSVIHVMISFMAIYLGKAVIWGFSYHLEKLKDLSLPKKGFAEFFVQRKEEADKKDKQKALGIAESLAMVFIGASATMIFSRPDTAGDDHF
jgi:hypothetical protein